MTRTKLRHHFKSQGNLYNWDIIHLGFNLMIIQRDDHQAHFS